MSYRRIRDLAEAHALCAALRRRCHNPRFRDHILAGKRATDLATAQRHVVIAFEIALRTGCAAPQDWQSWKCEFAKQRHGEKYPTPVSFLSLLRAASASSDSNFRAAVWQRNDINR
jgi:hypothetical protein